MGYLNYIVYGGIFLLTAVIVLAVEAIVDHSVYLNRGKLELSIANNMVKKEIMLILIRIPMLIFVWWYIAHANSEVKWHIILCLIIVGAITGKTVFPLVLFAVGRKDYGIYENAVVTLCGSKSYRSIKQYRIEKTVNVYAYDSKLIFYSKYYFVSNPSFLFFNSLIRSKIVKQLTKHKLDMVP